jgi:hypothetical protein
MLCFHSESGILSAKLRGTLLIRYAIVSSVFMLDDESEVCRLAFLECPETTTPAAAEHASPDFECREFAAVLSVEVGIEDEHDGGVLVGFAEAVHGVEPEIVGADGYAECVDPEGDAEVFAFFAKGVY